MEAMLPPAPHAPARHWLLAPYALVLWAVLIGVLLGHFAPEVAVQLKPLGDAFIKAVRLLIAPIVFCTLVHGIASLHAPGKLGRIGTKAIVYFEVVSTFALLLGMLVANQLKPGAGMHSKAGDWEGAAAKVAAYSSQAQQQSSSGMLLDIIPESLPGAFGSGNLLQVLFLSLLAALALRRMGSGATPILAGIERASQVLFTVLGMIVRLAPLGALGAMSHTIGQYGLKSLGNLGLLMAGFYLTALLFVALVLGGIARACGFSLWRLLRHLREELLLVLGTSSSETALPGLMQKLRGLGCAPATVGLVVPTGYSLNLDGTNIYMSMAAIFLAQATDTAMSWQDQLWLLAVAMLTSKGASGVTGAGFITLAATLSAAPGIPLASMALLLGIDRFMSECRAITNLIGNAVATVVVSRWEGELDAKTLREALNSQSPPPPTHP